MLKNSTSAPLLPNGLLHEGGESEILVWQEDYAKKVFKELKKRGFIVDIGRCTGNIWTPGRKKKLTWMLKDFKNQWCIEILK